MLENWDFGDLVVNGTVSLVNRQKSARNLVVLSMDQARQTATFFDPKRKSQSSASLSSCDCRDFGFAGKVPRKKFQPCMHVYRLAMELGLIAAQHLDHDAREAIERREVALRKEAETARLQGSPGDPGQWGGWNPAIHASGLQVNRQYRAYFIVDDEPEALGRLGASWDMHGYQVSLSGCSCADFLNRRLPCKHVYSAALLSGLELHLTRAEYQAARAAGSEILFDFNEQADQ